MLDWPVTALMVVAILLGLVGLSAAGWALVLYVQFRNTPEKRWQGKVFRLLAAAQERGHQEYRTLRRLKDDRDTEADSLRNEEFDSYLCDISVIELDSYPGIGPATIGKLQGAGYGNLANLRQAHIRRAALNGGLSPSAV